MNKTEIVRPEKEFSTLMIRLKEALKSYETSDGFYGEYVADGFYCATEVKGEAYLNFCQRVSLRKLFVGKKTNKKVSKEILDDNWLPF